MRWGGLVLLVGALLVADAVAFNGHYRGRVWSEAMRLADVIGAEIGTLVRQARR